MPKFSSTDVKQDLTARRLQTIKYSISSASISHTDAKENLQTLYLILSKYETDPFSDA